MWPHVNAFRRVSPEAVFTFCHMRGKASLSACLPLYLLVVRCVVKFGWLHIFHYALAETTRNPNTSIIMLSRSEPRMNLELT